MLFDSMSWWNGIPTLKPWGPALQQMTDMQRRSKDPMHFSSMGRHHFCALWNHDPLNRKCTHAYSQLWSSYVNWQKQLYTHILNVMASIVCRMLRPPHHVESKTWQCTTVMRWITVGCVHICNGAHPTTPNGAVGCGQRCDRLEPFNP